MMPSLMLIAAEYPNACSTRATIRLFDTIITTPQMLMRMAAAIEGRRIGISPPRYS